MPWLKKDRWCGHRVFAVDGSTVTLEDTPENQEVFSQQSVQKPGCGFPIMRLVAFFSLATGMITAWATGNGLTHEITLFQLLWEQLSAGDVLLGDRGFGSWATLAQCRIRGLEGVFRVAGARKLDWRKGKRLSRDERLVQWLKPVLRPPYLSAKEWAQFAPMLELRLVRVE